jgi:prostaglandin-E synthase
MGANGLKVFAMQKLDMGGADDEDIEDEVDDVVESANNGTTLSLSCQ